MVKMDGGLLRLFTFMLGVSELISITRVLPYDVTYLGRINYLYSKAVLKGIPVLKAL